VRFTSISRLVFVASLCAGCEESVAPAEQHLTAECRGAGTDHSNSVATEERWTAAASPHHVLTNLDISARLLIEPGALVCVATGANLRFRNARPEIVGTLERPILFTRRDTLGEWHGLELSGGYDEPVVLRHVVIQDAAYGILAYSPILIDSSAFRRISDLGIGMAYYGGGIANSSFDSVGTMGNAIAAESGTLLNNVVRNSGPVVVSVGSGCTGCRTQLIDGLRIESSLREGLVIGSPQVIVRNLAVSNAESEGVRVSVNGVRLESCSVTKNAWGGILIQADDVQIRDCNIVDNERFGMRAVQSAVDARMNYWGSSFGPTDPANNGVEGNVQFDPFRTTPVEL
jgi:hypothetical protein